MLSLFFFLSLVLSKNWNQTSAFAPFLSASSTCKSYAVKSGDTCYSISQKYSISVNDIETYNKKNYGWSGCNSLAVGYALCISSGDPPKPTPNPKAECGPYAPNELFDTKCPLNACCSQYGFCGLTSEFCEDKCYSNCNYGNLHTDTRSDFETIAYWMDSDSSMYYNLDLIDSSYTRIHYAFVNINPDFSIDDSKFSKSGFTDIAAKKVVSFGGWDFSTDPSTYHIFREGVTSANRVTLANNIVNFANKYNLDGIDLDWEYPGAPDIPGIPADSKASGRNYFAFVKLLKSKLGSKTLSMAIPSSYWYLKNYPIKEIESYVDYFVFMTYDLYGVWDQQKDNAIKCHVNKTAVIESMKLLDKAGVQIGKTYAGVANYGRSYKAASSSCMTTNCPFSGGGNPRDITNTPGVLAESEIKSIQESSSNNAEWFDSVSQCNFMRYDSNSIVSWGKSLDEMTNFIKSSGFKGSVLWTLNYFRGDDDSDGSYYFEIDDTTMYDYYQEQEELLSYSVIDDDFTLTNSESNSCNTDPKDIQLLTEENESCVYMRMVFELIGISWSSIDYLKSINREQYNKDHKLYNSNAQSSLWLEYDNWIGFSLFGDKREDEYGVGQKYYSCFDKKGNVKSSIVDCVINEMGNQATLILGTSSRRIQNLRITGDRNEAAESFSNFFGLNVKESDFVINEKEKKVSQPSGKTISYLRCEFVDLNLVFKNPLDSIDDDYLQNMQNILNRVDENYKDAPVESYYALYPLIALNDVVNTMKDVKVQAKKIRDMQRKQKILSIISYIFMGISIIAMPFSLGVNVAVDAAALIATTVSTYKLTGEVSGEDLAFGLIGIIQPFIKMPKAHISELFDLFDFYSLRKVNGKFKTNKKYDDIISNSIKPKVCKA